MKYASIIPLIGGETIAMANVFHKNPEYILSYDVFQGHDAHLLEHMKNSVPYHLIDDPANKHDQPTVEVVNSVCPCAGLSSLSTSSGADNKANDWMIESSQHVLEKVKPMVLFGENAPRLGTKSGEPVVARLRKVAEENGYVFSIIQTHSLHHGIPQKRNRTFYFFWKGNKIPTFNYTEINYPTIEEHILNYVTTVEDPMNEVVNNKIPSEDPYIRYVVEVLDKCDSFRDIQSKIPKSIDILDYIEEHENFETYNEVATWMASNGFERQSQKCIRRATKLATGGNIMRRESIIPKDHINAFVGAVPTALIHPTEDRYLNYRECLGIMGMPKDFILQKPKRNLNHICQNVPVGTAEDMAKYIKDFINGESEDYIEAKYVIFNNMKQTHTIKDQ